MNSETTITGFINRNQQVNLGFDNPNGTDHGQKVYALRCQKCGFTYGANGSDIHQRLCPDCQGGKPGLPLTKKYS
jgi:hypothetical protein